MTGADSADEQVAQRLAARGRDTLVERLRLAYTQAAEVHADVLSIDGDRLETIVQGAADRADGLQWRRALAEVASGELGISLTDALAHPAVARAQELVGAPTYEDSLAALSRRPLAQFPRETSRNGGESQAEPADEPSGEAEAPWQAMADPEALEADPPAEAEAEPGGEPEPQANENLEPEPSAAGPGAPPDLEPKTIVQAPADDPHATREWRPHEVTETVGGPDETVISPVHSVPSPPTQAVPAPAPLPPETTAGGHVVGHGPQSLVDEAPDWEPGDEDEDDFDDGPDGPRGRFARDQDRLRVTAIHLGGVANLPREGIELRLSPHGLDIMRSDNEILGRLVWSEIDAIEVPSSRVRRRRNRDRGRMIIRTSQGDASFEVPGFSSDELNERVALLLARFGRR